jgi:hypothetical protein
MGYLDNIHMGMVLEKVLVQVGNMMWGLEAVVGQGLMMMMMMMRGLAYMVLGWENLADVKLGGSYHKAKVEIDMMVGNLCYKVMALTFELIMVNCRMVVGFE